jgi:amidohydrolase
MTRRALAVLVILVVTPPIAEIAVAQQPNPRMQRVDAVLEAARDELIEIRRDLHRHPEVSGREERTAGVVAARLRELGLEVQTGVGGHGVVGLLRGVQPGPVVAYRADMDAVSDDSRDPVSFASETPGVRHICGHDIHTTVALGVAEALAAIREDLPGTVKLVFQPAEENVRGAKAMIRDGVLEDPAPVAIFAVHTAPLEVGQIGAVEGMGLPGLDRITIRVSGDRAADAARAYADLISAVSTVGPPGSGPTPKEFIWANAGRSRDPSSSGRWLVRGNVKASGEEQYALAKSRITHGLAEVTPTDAQYELLFVDRWLPDMINDPELVRASLEPIRNAVGEDGLVVDSTAVPYFGEDFAFYQQQIPGAMYWLGVSNSEKGTVGMPHTADYVADEEAIIVGARAMSAVMLDYLESRR